MRKLIMMGLLTMLQAPAAAQIDSTKILGSSIRLRPIPGHLVPWEEGELIAASADSLWLLLPRELVAVPREAVLDVRVDRKTFGAGRAFGWAAIGALVSGVALTAACNSVEDASCGGVFPATALLWALVGGAAAPSISGARWETIDAWRDLPPHARFPQGLPSGVDYQALVGGRGSSGVSR